MLETALLTRRGQYIMTQKKNKGASAYEIVKKKYGKTVMNVDKKKKEEK